MPDAIVRNVPLAVLAVLATVAALSLAETLLAPLTLSFVTAIVLAPVDGLFRSLRMRPTLAALGTLLVALAGLMVLAMVFRPWIAEVMDAWPNMRGEIRRALIDLRIGLSTVFDIQREVISAIDPASGGSPGNGDGGTDMPTLSDAAWMAPQALAQIVLFAGGLFFFLVGKDDLYAALTDRLGICAPGACAAAETRVARYFGTVALINLGFGAAVAIVLSLVGLPAAPLWGVIAGLANFVVYLGPAMVAAALVVAGAMSFDGAAALLPAAAFVLLNGAEGQFVTPTLLGRHMRLSPLYVFVSLAFWLWLWGPVGGIVAIPLLLWGLEILSVGQAVPGTASPAGAGPVPSTGATSRSVSEASVSDGSNEAGAKVS